MGVSEIRVKQIHVNQGLVVQLIFHWNIEFVQNTCVLMIGTLNDPMMYKIYRNLQ